MKNVKLLQYKDYTDKYGHLTPLEGNGDIPFKIKRVYYISKVKSDVRRGFHSHIDLEQVLICVNGSVKILTKTPYEEQIIELNDQTKGLYIGPMIWREMYDFSDQAVLLVLASKHYNEQDYIREYDEYERIAIDYFRETSYEKSTIN